MSRSKATVYVGNLPGDIKESEIDELFYKYGRIRDIDLKLPPRRPAYCFIDFEDSRDAGDAVRGRDGYEFDGYPLRVEIAHGGHGSLSSSVFKDTRLPVRRSATGYRVVVYGLPSSASWQDLKDHARRTGDVCFCEVYRTRSGNVGIVDYVCYDDMKYAVRKLDDSKFRNRYSSSYIRVEEDRGDEDRFSGSRSRSTSRSRNSSPSRSRRHSRSRSRNRSPSRSRRHSRSRSRSRRSVLKSKLRSPSLSSSRSSMSTSSHSRSRVRSPRRGRSLSRSKSRGSSLSGSQSRGRGRSRSRSRGRSPSGSQRNKRGRSLSIN